MPRTDAIHNAVKNALIRDGWTITHDPYTILYEQEKIHIDLGAERPFAAQRNDQQIVVEVKSFIGASKMHDFEVAVGQYNIYLALLEVTAPERRLFLAISDQVYEDLFTRKAFQLIVARFKIPLLVVDVRAEEVIKWIS